VQVSLGRQKQVGLFLLKSKRLECGFVEKTRMPMANVFPPVFLRLPRNWQHHPTGLVECHCYPPKLKAVVSLLLERSIFETAQISRSRPVVLGRPRWWFELESLLVQTHL
jgi:hypothetical protein